MRSISSFERLKIEYSLLKNFYITDWEKSSIPVFRKYGPEYKSLKHLFWDCSEI